MSCAKALGVFAALLLSLATAGVAHCASLVGTSETRFDNIAPFFKWTAMLRRFEQQKRTAAPPAPWSELLDEIRALPLDEKLARVNRRVNAWPYKRAVENWGNADVWETPFEFFQRGGQCQDYAIAKYMLLRAAGIESDRMRIVVLRDLARSIDHAVLVVFTDHGPAVLDNVADTVTPASAHSSYRPHYSINEHSWWRQ